MEDVHGRASAGSDKTERYVPQVITSKKSCSETTQVQNFMT